MWYIILTFLTFIYIIFNYYMPSGSMFEAYVIRPAIWITLAITTYLIAKNEGINITNFKKIRRWTLGKTPIHAGLLIGGFHVALLIIIGILFGFGKSPYSQTPTNILINITFVGSMLLGMELSRAYLIKKTTKTKKYTTIMLILITLLYMAIRITPNEFSKIGLANPEIALEFIGATIITALAINLLATYLSYLGGATASISYMGTLLFFEWFSPILPNPHWTILALIGTIAPAIGFIIIQDSIQPFIDIKKKKHLNSRRRKKQASGHGWTIVAIFALIMIFFSYGYLGVKPTVIYSGSMKPTYEVGDIILVEDDFEIEEIKKGDVIQFIRDNQTYMHRIYEITIDEKGNKEFIVKGDANEKPDFDKVKKNQITGIAVFNIPKIGWIQIFIKDISRKIMTFNT